MLEVKHFHIADQLNIWHLRWFFVLDTLLVLIIILWELFCMS